MSKFLVNPYTLKKVGDNPIEDDSNATEISKEVNNVVSLDQFWPKTIEEIRNIGTLNLKSNTFPLNRIKKIMKLDDSVKLVNHETSMVFSKAVEIFIKEMTLRGWKHTNVERRRTLTKNDIGMAINKYNQFDFLIDIAPRVESKTYKKEDHTSRNLNEIQFYFKNAEQQEANNTSASNDGQIIQIVQPVNNQVLYLENSTQYQIPNIMPNITTSYTTTVTDSQPKVIQLQDTTQAMDTNSNGVLKLVQQVVTHTGEIKHIPIPINYNNLNMFCMQNQNSPQSQ